MAYKSKTEKSYYKIKSDSRAPKALKVLKFDKDLELQSEYFMTYFEGSNKSYYDCACPAAKFDCRHQKIRVAIEAAGEVDGSRFYCFETSSFVTAEQI